MARKSVGGVVAEASAGGGRGASGPRIEVRDSPIHGRGVFARRMIRKGTRVMEYVGRILPEAEADALYGDGNEPDGIVLLFTLENGYVIDGAVGGNDARFINHSCDPNCETIQEGDRVFITALRTIRAGEELTYDYHLTVDPEADAEEERARYACRCGVPSCRGTLLHGERA